MPGSRLKASISFATGSMSRVATRRRRLWWSAPEEAAEPAECLHRAHLLLGKAARGVERLVDGRGDEVLEHLDVVRVDGGRVDRHGHERLLAGHDGPDDAAARRAFDLGLAELGLDPLHLLL